MVKSHAKYQTACQVMLCATFALTGAAAVAAIDDHSGDAMAKLQPTRGSSVAGTVSFKSAGADGVRIVVSLTGLGPNSVHGLHVHEKGDCSAPDATSAGGHFSLPGQEHGPHEGKSHHAGDLGNLTADASGKGSLTLTVPDTKLTVGPGPTSVVGRAVVVHGGPDDLKSQPAGNSGPRIACGVIDRETVSDGKAPMQKQ